VKSQFYIDRVDKDSCKDLLYNYHYLKDESKDFKSGYNYGLFKRSEWECPLRIGGCLAVCIFTGFPVPELGVSAFGLSRDDQEGLFELSRLCIRPDIQKEEYNITSWFVSKCIRRFRKDANVRAILSYADSAHHTGTIYRACNFNYFGLTDQKKDFYYSDGTKHSRGSVKGLDGEWRDRSRKHRFMLVFDKTLEIKWNPQKWKR
jgi:hypothetical protein